MFRLTYAIFRVYIFVLYKTAYNSVGTHCPISRLQES
jgi:hypothetical protein